MIPMTDAELEALKARHRPSLMDTSKCDTYDCGLWPCPIAHLIADLEEARVLEACREELQQWAQAYSSDILVVPAEAEIMAVNRTPEFTIGRNAALLNIREKLLLPLIARLNERLGVPPGSGEPAPDPSLSGER